jgi:hypothetical protein
MARPQSVQAWRPLKSPSQPPPESGGGQRRRRASALGARGRRVLLLALLPVAVVQLDGACKEPPNLSFGVTLPSALAGQAAWYEIGAFSGGTCPNATQLAGGIPSFGPVARLVFGAGDPTPPGFGDLPRANYGFAAVALSKDCAVIAQGCTTVDVSSASAVTIALSEVSNPAGACESGATCTDAVCVGGLDGGNSGCSLTLVGGGPLADPLVNPELGMDSTILSPPAIVATSSGFLIAYREFDANSGSARLTVIPDDDDGSSSAPHQTMLEDRCTGSPESDGTALAWAGTGGVVALARQTCPSSSPGVDVYAVNAEGATVSNSFNPTASGAVLLSQSHALASTPAGVLLATVTARTPTASVTPITGSSLGSSMTTEDFGNVTAAVGAYVTGSSLGTGLLSLGTPKPVGEAGVEGGTDAAPPDPLDSGLPLHTFSLTNLPASGSLSKLPKSSDGVGSWVSIGSVDSRVLVATNGSATANPIVWYAFDLGSVTPTAVDSFAPNAMGTIVYADVALHADNAFFAVATGDSIALLAFRKASTYLQMVVEKDFATDSRIPIGSIRDGLVAVAADDSRVAVVWGTGRTVSTLEDLGGYAVFACTP